HASGHIIEQIDMINKIFEAGYAYENQGSVYFDVKKYDRDHNYGKLSGRSIDEALENTRALAGQDEKKNQVDFALWKKATPQHIMHWPSPWSEGFPGWHLECTAMGCKYLGQTFDIHGGGMDLVFPHHESEIAQAVAAFGNDHVRYWMHNNMITIDGQKMGKSLNNFITLDEFFTGTHALLHQAYSPITIRFFILQAHYRSTVDFSNEALLAAQKGLDRLLAAAETLKKLKPSDKNTVDAASLREKCYEAMNDDFNSPIVIAHLFEAVRIINCINDGKESIDAENLESLKATFNTFVFDILGFKSEADAAAADDHTTDGLMNLVLDLRQNAKNNKDWAAADKIRDSLKGLNIEVKDTKEGAVWCRI
ncbi:MAG: cysteine--tRNA ligase, partial [Bacteroidales bacterium]|nr:cysteine--tRNA ligase [Bacteroidales bacterium]